MWKGDSGIAGWDGVFFDSLQYTGIMQIDINLIDLQWWRCHISTRW